MYNDSKRRLGKGLAALIGDVDGPSSPLSLNDTIASRLSSDFSVSIEQVVPNPQNPRSAFSEFDLEDLVQSIREHGIVQPIIVRSSSKTGFFEIIAGERRWRAAQRAGLLQIPVVIKEANDRTALEIAIIENVQRTDLNPIEEAIGYQKLIENHGYTQTDLAQVVGKSRSHITNTLRLLKLPDSVRSMLTEGSLSAGHARTLVTAENPEQLALRIISEGLSVRQAETLSRNPESFPSSTSRSSRSSDGKNPDILALEQLLSDILGLRVVLSHKEASGEVRISYKNLDQLDDLCRRLQACALVKENPTSSPFYAG